MKTLFTTALLLGLMALGSAKPVYASEVDNSLDSDAPVLSLEDSEDLSSTDDLEEEGLADNIGPGGYLCLHKCQVRLRMCVNRCQLTHNPLKERLCINHCRVQFKRCQFSCRFD